MTDPTGDKSSWCDTCKQTHEKCAGHTRAGNPCRQNPLAFQKVCRMHGGSSPQALESANRRAAEARAEAEVRKLIPDNIGPVTDPLGLLAQLAGEADAFRQALAAKVNELNKVSYRSVIETEQIRAEVILYERALDRTAKLCEAMIRSDYLERHARIQEAHAQLLLVVVRDALGLVGDDTLRQQVTMRIVDGLRTLPG